MVPMRKDKLHPFQGSIPRRSKDWRGSAGPAGLEAMRLRCSDCVCGQYRISSRRMEKDVRSGECTALNPDSRLVPRASLQLSISAPVILCFFPYTTLGAGKSSPALFVIPTMHRVCAIAIPSMNSELVHFHSEAKRYFHVSRYTSTHTRTTSQHRGKSPRTRSTPTKERRVCMNSSCCCKSQY
jgi:hypothetical protein